MEEPEYGMYLTVYWQNCDTRLVLAPATDRIVAQITKVMIDNTTMDCP